MVVSVFSFILVLVKKDKLSKIHSMDTLTGE